MKLSSLISFFSDPWPSMRWIFLVDSSAQAKERKWRHNWIVLMTIVCHSIYGVTLLFSVSALYVTALAHMKMWDHWIVGIVYLLASFLAAVPVIRQRAYLPIQEFFFLALQQWLMMMTLWTIVFAIYNGQYPDGYIPNGKGNPHVFIFQDQLFLMGGILAHTCSVIDWIYFSRKNHASK